MRISYDSPTSVATPFANYSHVARVEIGDGALLFLSGQAPVSPDGVILSDEGIDSQVRLTFDNIAAVLESQGATMDNVVKTTTYLTDMSLIGRLTCSPP